MTTIIFEKNLKIKKLKFKDLSDFEKYVGMNFYFTEFKKAKKSEITPAVKAKMKKTQKLKAADFANL